jgi:hypothetical protein
MAVVWTVAISCWPRLSASSLGLGGSTPNNRGVSPFWTQRQNFFSAVIFDLIEAGVVNTRKQQDEVIDLVRGFRAQVL